MAIRNPFDQIILDDPAYAEETKIDPQAGKKLTRDIYGLILGEEDPYANKKLERELSVALAQKEAGLPVDPNKSFVTSAERQDPILGPALKKFGYESMGLGEVGERSLEFLYRDQLKAREKQLRGEELSFGEKIAANPFMAALDAADLTGLIGLATKGGIKLSAKGLQTLTNLKNQGASKEVINQVMTKQFPDDAQKIGLVYYQSNRPPGMETSQLLNKADDGGSSMPKGLQIGHDINSARRLESKNKLLKVINDAKQSGKKYKQKLDIYKEADISKFVGKSLGDEFAEIRQDTDFLINKPDKPNKDVVLEFLKQDPNKKYTIKEIAESTGLSYQQVNKVKETNRTQIGNRFVSPKDEGIQRRNDMREYLDNIPEGSYVPSDFLAKEFNTTANEVGVFLQSDPKYRNKVRLANTYDFGFNRGFETVPQFLKQYIETAMNDGRFHYRDELTNVDFNGNKIDPIALTSFFGKNPDYKKYFAPTEFQQKGKGRDITRILNENKEELGYTAVGSGPRRAEYNFLYDYLRSADPNLFPDFKGSKAEFYQTLLNDLKDKNWKELYRQDIDTIRELDTLREQGTEKIKDLFESYKQEYPQQFKNLNKGDFVLHLAHNFPLQLMRGDFGFAGSLKGSTRLSLARTNMEHHRKIEDEVAEIVNEVNKKYVDKGFGPQQKQQIPPEINKKLAELDKKANKLGTVVYFKFGNQQYKVGNETPPSVDDLVNAAEKYFQYVAKQSPGYTPKKTDLNFGDVEIPVNVQKNKNSDVDILTKAKGGQIKPVKMAIGGDPLENINQQQFASDPATDDNFFQQAVQDENLLAFNPANLFKIFKKSSAVATPNKVVGGATDAPTNMLPATAKVDIDDFPFKSHFIDTLSEQNIPNIDSPQGWRNLFEGTKGFAKSELEGAGIMGYLEDAEKFMPGMKITKQNLLDVYEKSPIANLEIKVKTEVPMPGDYKKYVGSAKHKNMGNAPIDEGGTDYRNIVINVKEIPGQDKAFFNQGHFDKDPNVLAFTRVANYKNATGDNVAVIQELQTDLITNLRKEQERVKATASAVRNKKERLQENLINYPNDEYSKGELDRLNAQYPEKKLKFLETTDLTRPADPVFLEQLAPELTTQLNAIQDQINNILAQNRGRIVNPNYLEQIKQLQDQGLVVFNRLFDLNRQKNFDDMLQGAKVTDAYQSSQILDIGAGTNVPTGRDVQSFGQIPFGKGPDWIDLMLKATIQDAQSRGINKVAIMPADIVNQRWRKDIDGAEAEKFKTIYDKISVQELKNIAKKYTGNKANLQIEEIVDPNKPQQAFQVMNKNVDGTFDKKDMEVMNPSMPVGSNIGPDDTADFNYQIYKVANDFDYGDVVVRKEIAPGQVMDYYVKVIKSKEPKIDPESGIDMSIARQDTIEFVPLKEDQIAEDSKVIIEEFNPSLQKMYVLTMPEETTKKGPMFLFRKKDGGKIKSDGLVSITDIYGDY
jgi:hypothetical protein